MSAALLAQSPKGWRFRRTGETIQRGDLMPAGPVWQPVADWMIGGQVLGARDVGDDGEYIIAPRKRIASRRSPAGQTSCPNGSHEPCPTKTNE